MKLTEVLTESLGKLGDIVGTKLRNVIDWKLILGGKKGSGSYATYHSTLWSQDPKTEKITGITDPVKVFRTIRALEDKHQEAGDEIVGFVIASKGRPIIFAPLPESPYDSFRGYVDFSGLVDDEEFESLVGDGFTKKGHKAGSILFDDADELSVVLKGLVNRGAAESFDVTVIMSDYGKAKKQTERRLARNKDASQKKKDARPLSQKKAELMKKHKKPTREPARELTFNRTHVDEAMYALDLPRDFRDEIYARLEEGRKYSENEIREIFKDSSLEQDVDKVIEVMHSHARFRG